jgi:hypothetical protein
MTTFPSPSTPTRTGEVCSPPPDRRVISTARSLRPVEVNGGPGALYLDAQQRLIAVVALEVAGGQVTSIHAILNPDKLTRLGPVGDFGSLWGWAG